MPRPPSADAPRIFTGIARTYDRAGALFSFGQDPRWRHALVGAVGADADDVVLDVATGTGLVAIELARRYRCRVVGLDRSADMLAEASRRNGLIAGLVNARAERLPFDDATFDHVTFTYLLRYVDDPAATVRELARVLKPGGRLAALEFGVPTSPFAFALWRLYTRVAMPLAGPLISRKWREVNAFLGPSIERFYRAHPQSAVERYWRDAGLADVHSRRMSLGGGIVMTATKREAPAPSDARLGSAFYALRPGGWRDYWTLLHPPYTAWHLSYVLLGAALSPAPDPRIVLGAVLAFGLGVGVAAHSFDELQGRPLGTRIPARVLVALGALGLAAAAALGIAAIALLGPAFGLFVATGVALVLLYAFEAPLVHSDLGFALAWGAFPTLTAAYATGAPPIPAVAVATAAALLSLAQRVLSTRVRAVRRRSLSVTGEVRYRDGSRERLDAEGLIASAEGALRILWLAVVALAVGLLLSRY
ncbi:MAG TPA: class I SAM-dependent methyltransferase [Candidatus Limnocylindria bacterium]|nr:class I SAM-dependent methyltransferase [Candidatus Limnocylindria bacterium]